MFDYLFPQCKGHDKDGSNKYSFNCRLANFTKDANDFGAEMAPYLSDVMTFCASLSSKTMKPQMETSILSNDPASSQGRKRCRSTAEAIDPPNAKMTKKGYKEQKRDLEEKIPYQISEISCVLFFIYYYCFVFVVSLTSMYSSYLDCCQDSREYVY